MPEATPHVARALDRLVEQPRVREFLSSAVREGRVSHAYLFCGAPGSGMELAAECLAQCVVCPADGDGTCTECVRVAHHTHPDVHWLAPASVSGYLVAQVRELIDDVSLAPVRSEAKVYVLDRVELLRGAAANALLKTLEEPPANVVFVLIARSLASVMETIASRCQVVPFQVVTSDIALDMVRRARGVSEADARIALAVAGTPSRAVDFLASSSRRQVRKLALRTVSELAHDDSWDVLVAAKELVEAVKLQLADLRDAQKAAVDESSDFLTASALKQVEEANKRELTARERSGMMELLAAVESLLRDVLLVSEGLEGSIVNVDAADTVMRLASSSDSRAALAALEVARKAADDLGHNVSPQLTVEVMLLGIKEAFACQPSSR